MCNKGIKIMTDEDEQLYTVLKDLIGFKVSSENMTYLRGCYLFVCGNKFKVVYMNQYSWKTKYFYNKRYYASWNDFLKTVK